MSAGNPLPEREGRVRGRPLDTVSRDPTAATVRPVLGSSKGLNLTPAPVLTGEGFLELSALDVV
ncbi:hypothetical protein ASE63_02120 [Bosea sp. Root381]|nr:hypothetical protein ASE63_02120 [Bosea sp. Root381]